MADTLETANLGIEVPIGSIEKELKKLWEADQAQTNASLMNFVIFSEEEGALEKNSQIMQKLTREHACRGMLINLRRDFGEVNSRAWITAHCHIANGQKSVCCEQIAFLLHGYSVGRLRNVIFAHAGGDLPLVVWWQGSLSNIFLERLYSVIDRFIFDSSQWEDPKTEFAKVNEALENSTNNLVVQDLSWTRTFHYRLAVASLFDEPCAQNGVSSISRISVMAHPEYKISANMLIAWLLLKLQGKLSSKQDTKYIYKLPNGEQVEVELMFDDSSAPISSLLIDSDEFRASITREKGSATLRQKLDGDVTIEDRIIPADADQAVDLVADQLSRGGKNSLFREVLPAFYELF